MLILPIVLLMYARAPAFPQAADPSSPPSYGPAAEPFTDAEIAFGSTDAKVTVIEYLSDTCAHCAAFDQDVFDPVTEEYIDKGKIRFVVREMPSAPVAVAAAGFLLARCAGRDKYWSTIRIFLHNLPSILNASGTAAQIARLEEVSDTPPDVARACLTDADALKALNARRQAGLNAGVEGTPTFIFNGRMLRPGDRFGGEAYAGGELTRSQFDAAYRSALRRPAKFVGSVRRAPDPAPLMRSPASATSEYTGQSAQADRGSGPSVLSSQDASR